MQSSCIDDVTDNTMCNKLVSLMYCDILLFRQGSINNVVWWVNDDDALLKVFQSKYADSW